MLRFRSILSVILVLVATFLVSCAGPEVKVPTTYSPEKIAQIQTLAAPVEAARERMSALEALIDEENWIDIGTYIHGPLGSLRRDLRYLSESLLPKDQKKAKELAKELFNDFERLDAAAKERNYGNTVSRYNNALRHLEDYLDLIPQSGEST